MNMMYCCFITDKLDWIAQFQLNSIIKHSSTQESNTLLNSLSQFEKEKLEKCGDFFQQITFNVESSLFSNILDNWLLPNSFLRFTGFHLDILLKIQS